MKSKYPRAILGDLIVHQKGHPFKSRDYQDKGIPVVRVSNFTEDSIDRGDLKYVSENIALLNQKASLKTNDVIIATVGSWPKNPASIVGKTISVPHEMDGALMNQNSVILRVKNEDDIDQKYLFIALKTKSFSEYLVSTAQGSANQASVTLSDIFSYEIEWPNQEIRQSIVGIVDSLNQKIIVNRQTNQTLEQIAQALFKSWFVDFDPVKAKIAAKQTGGNAEQIERAAMAAISGKTEPELDQLTPEQYANLKITAALFPDELIDSELGEIPMGWLILNLEEISEVITKGTTPRKSEIAQTQEIAEVPFIKVKDIQNTGEINKTGLELIPASISQGSLKRSILKSGDLLFSIAGTIGRVAIIDDSLENSNTNQAAGIVRLKDKESHLSIVWQLLLSHQVQDEIFSKLVQGVQANASLKNLREIKVLMPCKDMIEIVGPKLDSIRQKILQNRIETLGLTEFRDLLLPRILSGTLELK